MSVWVERDASVTTVIIDRPEARNAVDGPTAAELVAACRAFDADAGAAVAVLVGSGETFCAGADLKAVGAERGDRLALLEAEGLPEREGLAVELQHGLDLLAAGAREGAARFAAGAGRHGRPAEGPA